MTADGITFRTNRDGKLEVLGARPSPNPSKDGWHHFTFERAANPHTFLHHDEEIDGVLFVATRELDEHGRLIRKTLMRADQVRG